MEISNIKITLVLVLVGVIEMEVPENDTLLGKAFRQLLDTV